MPEGTLLTLVLFSKHLVNPANRRIIMFVEPYKLWDRVATSSRFVTAVDVPPISWYGWGWGCDATARRLRAHSSRRPPPPEASPWSPPDPPPRRRIACRTDSHLLRLDFLIFLLKKQQHFVSSTTSTSALPTAIGAFDLSAVAPSSSRERSMFVDPRTTWTEGWRFSWVSRCPRPSIPLGFDSDHAAFFRSVPSPSLPVRWRSRFVGVITSWFVWIDPTGVDIFRPVQSYSPSSTYPLRSQRSWKSLRR